VRLRSRLITVRWTQRRRTLLDEAERAWDDVEAGRVKPIAELRAKYPRRR